MASEKATDISSTLRGIPSVTSVLSHPLLAEVGERRPPKVVALAVRSVLDEVRESILSSNNVKSCPDRDGLAARVAACLEAAYEPSLHGAINATGIVLHTGLGRYMAFTSQR